MSEAVAVVELAVPFVKYVMPAVLLFSIFAVAETFYGFLVGLINSMRSRYRI